jgi:uncharacterized protein (TIGR02284 family)
MHETPVNYNIILEDLYDSIKTLSEFSEQTPCNSFKSFLLSVAEERMRLIAELKQIVTLSGGVSVEYGTLSGPLHHLFLDIKNLMTDQDKNAIKNKILREDESLIKAYNDAIRVETSQEAKEILSRQLMQIHKELALLTEAALLEEALSI